jgi:tetratricopeptide (TPR) repeat protein
MSLISASSIDSLFSVTMTQASQLDGLSNSSLSQGIDSFMNGDFDKAIQGFKKTIALSPQSDNAANAFIYMAQAYIKQQKGEEAIKTYQNAIKLFPSRDDFHVKLGDIYMIQNQFSDAEKEYKQAVNISPTTPLNRYSLGDLYLKTDRPDAAEIQFNKLIQLSPRDPSGYFGLGEVARSRGQYEDAVGQFEKAVAINKNFPDAYLNLGYTYADMGNTEKAYEQVDILQQMGSSLSYDLQDYMYQVANPKFVAGYSLTGFNTTSGPGTYVSDIGSSLSAPNALQSFTMNFIFSKKMDTNSVQNIANWQIGRESGANISNAYNFGMPLPSTEVNLPVMPENVVYDPKNLTAVVTFRISQNSAGDGTIDPGHIMFKFMGIDAYGKAMDPSADEYSGFSKIV